MGGDTPTDPGVAEDGVDRAERLAVYASGRLVDSGAHVGAIGFDSADAGRELADGRVLSGWSVFTGEESEEELADAERIRIPSLAWVLRRDPAVALVTAGHDGADGFWVRHEAEDEHRLPRWEVVTD